jgi:AcrR family transcriptional regulator
MPAAKTARLTAQDWIDLGLKTLAQEGSDGLKADLLARKLRVSRGSFYWHFDDLEAYHRRLISFWKQSATEAIIDDLEQQDSPAQRIEVLLERAFSHGGSLEIGIRAWAGSHQQAALAVKAIDRRRRTYIAKVLHDAGIPGHSAATRAQLLYWAYLGAALSGSRLAGEPLRRTVLELIRLALEPVSPAGRRN